LFAFSVHSSRRASTIDTEAVLEGDMTEAKWLAATDPTPLLKFLLGKVSDRKLRLFGLDCCRLVLGFLDQRGLKALDAAERYADGQCDLEELAGARSAAHEAFCEFDDSQRCESAAHAVYYLCHAEGLATRVNELAWETAAVSSYYQQPQHLKRATRRLRRLRQSRILGDLFGNPFHPVITDPAWLTSTVLAIAQQMYDSRDFSLMPILADALQDAGCENEDILNHCRSDGPHVKGCWVSDLMFGKK
jgi:hypothetical protein